MKLVLVGLLFMSFNLTAVAAEDCSDCYELSNWHNDITGNEKRCRRIALEEANNEFWLIQQANEVFGKTCEKIDEYTYFNPFPVVVRCKGVIKYRCYWP